MGYFFKAMPDMLPRLITGPSTCLHNQTYSSLMHFIQKENGLGQKLTKSVYLPTN